MGYTGLDGKLYEVSFVADELGYRPVGGQIHPAHRQAMRQARMLAGQRHQESRLGQPVKRTRGLELKTRGQERQTRLREVRDRGQEVRRRHQSTRTRST